MTPGGSAGPRAEAERQYPKQPTWSRRWNLENEMRCHDFVRGAEWALSEPTNAEVEAARRGFREALGERVSFAADDYCLEDGPWLAALRSFIEARKAGAT